MFDEARLDDTDALTGTDRSETLRALATAGSQVRRALRVAQEVGLDRITTDRPRGVVVAAEGGSAAVADVFEAVSSGVSAVPVQVCGGGALPGWVGPLDLVVAVSQSGRAPGTLALAAEAARRGASLVTVGADGTPLADVTARARGVHVPVSFPGATSRTSVWGHVTPALVVAQALGLGDAPREVLESVADALDARAVACAPTSEAFENPAKILALEVAESVPIILGSGVLGATAARRAAAMFGRMGRVPVAAGALPDAASQIVACFDGPYAGGRVGAPGDDIFADPFIDGPAPRPLRLVMLSDEADAPEGSTEGEPEGTTAGDARGRGRPGERETLQELTRAVITAAEDAGVRVSLVPAVGRTALARLASHVALTDFAAAYVALGHGFDPGGSPHLRLLRRDGGV